MQLFSEPSSVDSVLLAQRLERGDVVSFAPCPFPLPQAEERLFLYQQKLRSGQKAIGYVPGDPAFHDGTSQGAHNSERLRNILHHFSVQATAWLAHLLPEYARGWRLDRASYHPEEEATRQLRHTARNDLLHLDSFPTRPSQGRRILRLFVNLHPTDPRVWVTSDTFAQVLAKYGRLVGLPDAAEVGWTSRLTRTFLGLFQPATGQRTTYDWFMLRLHRFLKTCEEFQDRARRRIHHFAPGSAWLAFTDGVCYAELRGQYALDHSYFIDQNTLVLPSESPARLLEQACGQQPLPRAA